MYDVKSTAFDVNGQWIGLVQKIWLKNFTISILSVYWDLKHFAQIKDSSFLVTCFIKSDVLSNHPKNTNLSYANLQDFSRDSKILLLNPFENCLTWHKSLSNDMITWYDIDMF